MNLNIVVIASIGNQKPGETLVEGNYPALFDNCIAVGATDIANRLSAVTILHPQTEINAPGVNIMGFLNSNNIPVITPNGTSQATAIVAGICALIISRYKTLGKSYTPASIKELLINNFDPVVDSPGQKLISPKKIFTKINSPVI